jgi:SAM-dependent methyltransferase
VDRDPAALALVAEALPAAELLQADLEGGPWPLPGRQFDAIVVTNYLWRPLMPALLAALAPGGVYVHETFADGHQHIGRPSRPDFLLQRGELLRVCAGLRVVAYEDGFEASADGVGSGRCVQRIVAVNETAAGGVEARWPLG